MAASRIADFDFSDAIAYHEGQFPPDNIDIAALLDPLLDARASLAAYGQMLERLPNSDLLLAPLKGQEAVASSRMEGTFSTLEDVLRLQSEFENTDTGPQNENTAYEVLLYSRALRQAQIQLEEGYPVTEAMIRGAHRTLLSFGRGMHKDPGRYKSAQNYIGDERTRRIDYIPISHVKLPSAMQSLITYIHDDTVNSLIRIAVSHVEFEALHPFKDGNGRVGRMIITLLLSSYGLLSAPHFYLSGYFDKHKLAYVDAIRRVSSENDWTGWCRFFLIAIKEQADETLLVARQIADHYDMMKSVFSGCLRSQWSQIVLDYVFQNPSYVTAPRLAKYADIKIHNASRFVKLLDDEKIIVCTEAAAGRRAAVYEFPSLLDIVRR